MNLTVLEPPKDEAEWPNWLERQIVGLDLRLFVRQLEIISGEGIEIDSGETWSDRLDTEFAPRLPAILQQGLGVLSTSELRQLLRAPRLMLALQERVFTDGGAYWESVPRTKEHLELCKNLQNRMLSQLESTTARATVEATKPTTLATANAQVQTVSTSKASTTRRNIVLLVALAASVALIVFMIRPDSSNQFFARPGLLTSSQRDTDFLQSLANSIRSDWQANGSERAFKRQLLELRNSCDSLVAADLNQLDSAVAADLKNRCRSWRSSLTQLLEDLDGGRPVEDVRTEANAIVDRLVQVLPTLG